MADFVFSYEHKGRELESLILLKLELEKRGYSVALFGSYEKDPTQILQGRNLSPKVVVVSALYRPGTLTYFSTQLFGFKKKIANLQWEQVLVSGYESKKGWRISNFVRNAVHFCWGEKIRERLLSYGVPANKAVTVGHLCLDYNRPEFHDFIMKREELASQFKLDRNKEWVLFVSSFNVVDCDPLVIEDYVGAVGEEMANKYVQLSVDSRKKILQWFDSVLQNYPEKVLIYRPHPNEVVKDTDPMLNELKEKHHNFRVIKDHAIKHWIANCEIVYNWTSTSMIDILQLSNNWHIIRPIEVPGELDYSYMASMPSLVTLEEFSKSFNDKQYRTESENEFEKGSLDGFYINLKDETPAYIKIANVLEEMLNNNYYNLQYPVKYIITCIFEFLTKGILCFTYKHQRLFKFFKPILGKSWDNIEHQIVYLKNGYSANVATENEIKTMEDKLRPIICGKTN